MKISITLSCLAAFTIFLTGVPSNGQERNHPAPVRSESPRIGIEGGLTYALQNNTWTSKEGAAMGYAVALAYDAGPPWLENGSGFRMEGTLGVRTTAVESRHRAIEVLSLTVADPGSPDGRDTARVNVEFENVRNGVFTYASIAQALKYYPVRALYVGAGLDLNILLSGWTRFTKIIIDTVVNVENMGITEVSFGDTPDPYVKEFPKRDRDDASRIGIGGSIFAGAEIPLGESMAIGPRIRWTFPFNAILPDPRLIPVVFDATIGLRVAF